MRESDSIKPAIFAMSNPTANGLFLKLIIFSTLIIPTWAWRDDCLHLLCVTAECTAEEAFKHAGENIVFASGSPFDNVDLGILVLKYVL